MENYLMLNGKRIDLTEEQVKTLSAEEKKSPFERKENGIYYSIASTGVMVIDTEEFGSNDNKRFSVANYCTDKAMMEQRALHETLNRLLWRYSEEHGGDSEWDYNNVHYCIVKYMKDSGFEVIFIQVCKNQGTVYFKNEETALSAIDEIVKPFIEQHPEFVW